MQTVPPTSPRYAFIVARSANGVIGADNAIPWRVRTDMREFRRITMGKPVIMGRKTFASLKQALPGRVNIVLSREEGLSLAGAHVVRDKAEAMALAGREAARLQADEIMVMGGEQIFAMFADEVSRIYLTEIEAHIEGDTRFDFDLSGWVLVSERRFPASADDQYPFAFRNYERA